jgi:hypothetical protein
MGAPKPARAAISHTSGIAAAPPRVFGYNNSHQAKRKKYCKGKKREINQKEKAECTAWGHFVENKSIEAAE